MGVYIKGMEMPKSCWGCDIGPAFSLDSKHCPFYEMEGQEQENYQNKIADGCPISYVPPHGRLIDADALTFEDDYYGWRDKKVVEAAPTIIEAEEET